MVMNAIDDFRSWLTERTSVRAYFKWQEAGCPQGQDVHFWLEAEKELPVPQSLGVVMGSGYGADDPGLKGIIEAYKIRWQ